ncbi:hypothetical protein BD414DRAFT_484828 [Trametes punicea]|nr:hypothetical protein BD414DRAFT_484828 [Trametes punicea]
MPLVRCKFYDDNGLPFGRGCSKGHDCNFIHPEDPRWRNAPKPRVPYQPKPRDSGWNQRVAIGREGGAGGDRGYSGRGWKDPPRNADAGTGAGSSNPPTAPRALQNVAPPSSSSSGWGTSSFGGADWDPNNDDNSNTNDTSTTARANPAAGLGWEAIPSAPASTTWDWGDPTVGEQGQSSERDKQAADAIIGADPTKGKDADTAVTTPQWNISTPRSPQQSPRRGSVQTTDPRRRLSTSAGVLTSKVATTAIMSPSEEAAVSTLSRDVRKEAMRTLSSGVPAPIAVAGPSGTATAAKRTNPFAFPAYTPAERMDVVREKPAGPAREINMSEQGESSKVASSRANSPAPPPSPVAERSDNSFSQWEDYVRTLAKAVALKIDLYSLEETRQKQRALQRSPQFQSASMVAVHAQIDKLRSENDAKLRHTQKKFDDLMQRLMCFPENGPPATVEAPLPPEVENIKGYVSSITAWLDSITPQVQEHQERMLVAAQAKREADEKARADAKGRVAALEEARSRAALVTARMGDLEEKVTDLEHHFEELRIAPLDVDNVISRLLDQVAQELGFSVKTLNVADSGPHSQLEDGEVPDDPPPPPKTEKELVEECERLERGVAECTQLLEKLLKQIEEQKARNAPKDLAYHRLAADHAEMQIRLDELSQRRKRDLEIIERNRAELVSLRNALQQYKEQEPAPCPPAPSIDDISSIVIPLLRPELRSALHEALDMMRRGVDDALQKQQEDICMQVYTACQPVIRFIQSAKNHPEILMPPPPPPMQSVQHS